ncbi:MAG: CRISPR-associated endonuclease Cas3'', partial [Deltaproteobacteria bacterium]|nr:CRISPR-associated endonuclease Cas3'' [Deltaproteobacteria bacterium]
MADQFIAHPGKDGRPDQSIKDHLFGVARLATEVARKIGLPEAGELLGLLHDIGKYSKAFQEYIRSATGRLNPDEDGYVDATAQKGKIDHSTAGAQLCWETLSMKGGHYAVLGQILALCLASHHSGLIDCVSPGASLEDLSNFLNRMKKDPQKTFIEEIKSKIDPEVSER